ncbi:unnamed protein product [Mycena citricolor]|uniref:RING-type domain-containing protein n=1 Tax=Mycena citricolor TaxID=2018698 RepID=A0AAD2HGL7_9AGAR|nr:unnamed protein product [Mycena citricolor]
MGQSASHRRRSASHSNHGISTRGASADRIASASAPTEPAPRTVTRTRRPSKSRFRNSILGLVGKMDGRRSRRASCAPEELDVGLGAGELSFGGDAVEPQLPDVHAEQEEEEALPLVQNFDEPPVETLVEDFAETADETPEVRERAATPVPYQPALPVSPPVTPPARTFPPHGTLVVVQGVVHTTDIQPSNSNPINSNPSDTDGANSPSVPISNSSIDVLGTLLTVAAQATAASLLSSASAASAPSASSPSTRSATPPTAAAESLGDAREPSMDSDSLTPTTAPTSLPATPASPAAYPQDERTRMLSEMARAFNVGLGLGLGNNRNGGGASISDASPTPDEGTFERFLVDLQAELRVALSGAGQSGGEQENSHEDQVEQPDEDGEAEDEAEGDVDEEDGDDGEDEDEDEDGDDDDDSTEQGSEPLETPASDSASTSEPSGIHAQEELRSDGLSITHDASPVVEPSPLGRPGIGLNWWRLHRFPAINSSTAYSALALAGSNSMPEQEHLPQPVAQQEQETVVTNQVTAAIQDGTAAEAATSASTRDGRTMIPVILIGLQSVQLGSAAAGVWGAPGAVQAPPPVPELEEQQPAPELPATTDPFGPIRERAARRRSWWRRARESVSTGRLSTPPPSTPTTDTGDFDLEAEALPGPEPVAAPGPEVVQESEVASEPQAGSAAEAVPEAETGGRSPMTANDSSQTFLIYVIGGKSADSTQPFWNSSFAGYYPPDHGLLADGVQSFEALIRELGDLLGHMRPTTATKTDIERAGLPVMHRDGLKSANVIDNCIEKCLICLDDYEEMDDIRVLSCRHAFHQGCVDRWLETGKNNCPACRGKGVTIDPIPPRAAMPAPPTV